MGAMGYPAKLLSTGETIEFEMRPHWRSMIGPALWLILIAVVFGLVFAVAPDGDAGTWLEIVAGLIALGFLTSQDVFTDRRIITRTGLVARSGRDMPLSKVNDVSFRYTFIERLINCGTLEVSSASDDDLVIANVPHVEEVQREIYRLRDADDARRRNQGRDLSESE
jgi:uncharacterized membrane protein YdbT with pleckstrin-like domain